jgi:hypothetical protein
MPIEYVEFPVLPTVKAHLIINCILVILTLVGVLLRMVARFESGMKLWWDDYLILLAMPQGIGMLIIQGMCRCPDIFQRFNANDHVHNQGPRWEWDIQSRRLCRTS